MDRHPDLRLLSAEVAKTGGGDPAFPNSAVAWYDAVVLVFSGSAFKMAAHALTRAADISAVTTFLAEQRGVQHIVRVDQG